MGIAPIVFDVLNMEASIRHHFAAYGHFSQAVADFTLHGILPRLGEPEVDALLQVADPYQYRRRVSVPKLILNAVGDEFFLPDSSQFYWDELRGENYLRYVPNANHSMYGTDVFDSVVAFHWLMVNDRRPPRFSWTRRADGTLQVLPVDQPESVLLWQATNPEARDFRLAILGPAFVSTPIEPDERGLYAARVLPPERGWTAWFLELTYDVGAPKPLKLTTDVVVTPDVLPFADKPLHLPTSVTGVCRAEDPAAVLDALGGASKEELDIDKLTTEILGDRLYVNWTPGDIRTSAMAVGRFLEAEGVRQRVLPTRIRRRHDLAAWAVTGRSQTPNPRRCADVLVRICVRRAIARYRRTSMATSYSPKSVPSARSAKRNARATSGAAERPCSIHAGSSTNRTNPPTGPGPACNVPWRSSQRLRSRYSSPSRTTSNMRFFSIPCGVADQPAHVRWASVDRTTACSRRSGR